MYTVFVGPAVDILNRIVVLSTFGGMPSLVVREPQGSQYHFRLEGPCAVFGRAGDCALVFRMEGVSRHHGRFYQDENSRWWIEDLQSKNGVLVNGRLTDRHRLCDGDTLQAGSVAMVFRADACSQSASHGTGVMLSPKPHAVGSTIEQGPSSAGSVDGQRLAALYHISTRLLNQRDIHSLIETAAAELTRTLNAGVVVFGLTCDPERYPEQLFVFPLSLPDSGVTLSLSILRRTLEAKRSILIADTGSEEDLLQARSIVSGQIRSALCVPLMQDQDITGFMYVDSRRSNRPYDEQDLGFAAAVGAMVGTAVENARLHDAEIAKQRMETELAGARRVQQAIMPSQWPRVAGWDICGRHRMCHEVGGDYYDAIVTSAGDLWLFAADVSGKGAGAALLASSVQTALHALVEGCGSPAQLLSSLNGLLLKRPVQAAFVTCVAVMIRPGSPELLLCSAGHPEPYLISGGNDVVPVRIEPAFFLGISDSAEYADYRLAVPEPGTSLLLYTDGVTEAFDSQGQILGPQRLAQALNRERAYGSASELVDTVAECVEAFRGGTHQSDDLTILACRRTR